MINTSIAIDNSREEREKSPSRYQMIRELEIENFRCFSSVKVPNIRRFTVVIGENGSGKTALLESMFVASGGSPEIYLRTEAWRGEGRMVIASENPSAGSLFEDFFHKCKVEDGLRICFKDSLQRTREMRIVLDTEGTMSLPFNSRLSESHLSPGVKFIWDTPEGKFESSVEINSNGISWKNFKNTYRMVFLNPQTFYNPKDNATRYSELSKKNREHLVVNAVSRLFSQISDLSIQMKGNTPTLFAQVEGVQNKMPMGLVSAGIYKFLSILLAITSTPQSTVLIDEVENGVYFQRLNPMWDMLMERCRENDCQLIVTTHSKEFLDSIAPLVERNKEDFSLLRTEWKNGEATVSNFSGEEFAAAITSGFEIR